VKGSVHFFDVFKDAPALGRVFAPGETRSAGITSRDQPQVLDFPVRRRPGVLGRTISLDGEPYTVIGVMPARIFDRTETKIWRPLAFGPENMTRDFHWFGAWALLKPGVTLEQARTQMDALAARIAQDYPKSNKGWGVGIDPFSEVLVNPALRRSLYVLMAPWEGAADRLRESGQSESCPGHGAGARGRDPGRPGSGTVEAHAPIPDGERGAFPVRRRAGASGRLCRPEGAQGGDPSRNPATKRLCRDGRTGAPVCPRRVS